MILQFTDLTAHHIRLPTSVDSTSLVYLTLHTNNPKLKGYSFTFIQNNSFAIPQLKMLADFIVGKKLSEITEHMGDFWRHLTLNTMSPALATNAVWDVWARSLQKPLWRLIVDMTPEELVHCLDFTSLKNKFLLEEALEILRKNIPFKAERTAHLLATGYPAFQMTASRQEKWQPLPGINEALLQSLAGAKLKTTGVDLFNYAPHLAMVDYIYISGSLENRTLEYTNHWHEYFIQAAVIENGYCQVPIVPGYTIQIKEASLLQYGEIWQLS